MSTQIPNSFNPSSSKTPNKKYDVFLSFRGADVRVNFLEHLYRALLQKGILTFKDNVKLENGEKINDGLLKAIEESKILIVVLSPNYADSSWCLRELVHILECKKTLRQYVYPVFYHVKPGNIRKQGDFRKGFAEACLGKEEEEVKRWKDALEEVGNLKGWDYPNARFETEAHLITDLVGKIFNESIDTYSFPGQDLVGMESPTMEVISLLNLGSDETRVVGLWGMGGIGKTTLAKVVYDSISWQFEACSFIDNVTEVFSKRDVLALQEHLISDILGEENFRVQSAMHGLSIIQNRVCRKKVLIVLDDVSKPKQVEDLVRKLQQFGRGNRIIITSRDKHVLDVCRVQDVFSVQKLDKDEAVKLFKSKAFTENGVPGEFHKLIDRSLQLGDSLDDELQEVLQISYDGLHWKDQQIFLDICSCFPSIEKARAVKIFDSCDFNAEHGISVLVKKSLLTISMDWLSMHDLVRKMGMSIIDKESINEPGKRSRLWRHNDVKCVLTENTGTEKVQGLLLTSPDRLELRPDSFAKMPNLRFAIIQGAYHIDLPNNLRYLDWSGCPLRCMASTFQPKHLVELHLVNSCVENLWNRKMELSQLSFLNLSGSKALTKSPDFTGFPNLKALSFEGCTSLLDLDPSIKGLEKLAVLNLKGCTSLQSLPYGFESQCFESLTFSGCLKLENILEHFGYLKRLWYLDLDGTGIKELPESIGNSLELMILTCSGCKKLKTIPGSISQLRNLTYLSLQGCSSLTELPEEVGLIHNLISLDLNSSGVTQLPASTIRLRYLQNLLFGALPSTSQISNSIPLDFSGFLYLTKLELILSGLTSFPESITLCFSLKSLYLGGDFESLPTSIKDLRNLEALWLIGLTSLQELPELPPSVIDLRTCRCGSLRTICSPTVLRNAKSLIFIGCPKLVGNEEIKVLLGFKFLYDQIKESMHKYVRSYCGPGFEIPEWIRYQSAGGLLKFQLPVTEDLRYSKLLGFAFSAVVATKNQHREIWVKMKIGEKKLKFDQHWDLDPNSTTVVISFYPIDLFSVDDLTHESTKTFELCFAKEKYPGKQKWQPAWEVIDCGVTLIYEDKVDTISPVVVPLKQTLMDLSNSSSLTKSPEFTDFPDLEELVLKGCANLETIDPSIKLLKKLRVLNLKGCRRLDTLPYGIESQCFEVLVFSGCLQLHNILEHFRDLKCLVSLALDGTGIAELPESIGNSTDLLYLSCSGCLMLKSIPSSIGKLKKLTKLSLQRCSSLRELPDELGRIDNLLYLSCSGCRNLKNIPHSIGELKKLTELSLQDCSSLRELPEQLGLIENLLYLSCSGCTNLKNIPHSIGELKKLRKLSFRYCSTLSELPDEVGTIDSLLNLDVSFSKVRRLPASVLRLTNLQELCFQTFSSKSVIWLRNLQQLFLRSFFSKTSRSVSRISNPSPLDFSGFLCLTKLHLKLNGLTSFPESISSRTLLKDLSLIGRFESLPAGIKDLRNLEHLELWGCKYLRDLPELPPSVTYVNTCRCHSLGIIHSLSVLRNAECVNLSDCPKLIGSEEIKTILGFKYIYNQIKENKHQRTRFYICPGSKIPEWINYQNVGGSLKWKLPVIKDLKTSNLLGIAFSVVVATKNQYCDLLVKMVIRGRILKSFGSDPGYFSPNTKSVGIAFFPIECFDDVDLNSISGNILEVCFMTNTTTTYQNVEPAKEVIECGAHLIYKDEADTSG